MFVHYRIFSPLAAVVTLALGAADFTRADLVITEFLSDNTDGMVADEDGAPSGWIEIHNPEATAISALGYTLSDNANNLQKWTFPNVSIPAGGYLLVFASGKDRAVAGSELHTNFSLNNSGEFLGLTKPDGATLTTSFHPVFPEQYENVSYGVGNGGPITSEVFLPLGAPLTYLVPSSDIGSTWQNPGFDDSSWTNARSAVGYGYGGVEGSQIGTGGNVQSVMRNVNATIYLRFPFQVVDPAGVQTMIFKVKIDDGFAVFLNGQRVAAANVEEPLQFDSSATTGEEVDPGEEYENYVLDFSGKLVAGENILAIQAMNSSKGSNDFIIIPELVGEVQDLTGPSINGYFSSPTPGTPNGPPSAAPPAKVTYSASSGTFTEDFSLTLSHPDPDALIRYTTDGSLPSNDIDSPSPAYTGPIEIDGSTLVRTRAFKVGALDGLGKSVGFVKLAASEADFSSDLPVVLLSTFNKGVPPDTGSTTRKDVFMLIYEPDPITGRTTFNSAPAVATRGGFRKRGSSSASFPKYAMSFESWNEFNEDKDISPLGFSSEADWILNARYTFDRSLMRNPFIYALSNDVGQWAVGTRFVELYNDVSGSEVTSNDYFGVYTFMDKIEIDKNRVDIEKTRPWETSEPEITGGYIFKNDRADPGEPTFSVSGFQSPLVHVDPDGIDINASQKSYLTRICNELTVALRQSNGIHPTTGMHFSDYMDVDGFIDHFWLNILVMDPDWGRLSQFFHKDRNGKIKAGPVWDYDRTMGSRDGRDDNPLRWEANTTDTSFTWFDTQYEWFGLLFGFNSSHNRSFNMANPQLVTARPDIFQKVIDRWYELRENEFTQGNMEAIIDIMESQLSEAQARNFARWPAVAPGGVTGINYAAAGTSGWAREVSHLRGWLKARSEWIDSKFFAPPTFNSNGGAVADGFALTMATPQGSVYFTTDGSDPRAAGGSPSVSAVQGGSLTLNETSVITARAYNGQQWGAPRVATFIVGSEVADSSNLVISEIMYQPAEPSPAEVSAGYATNNVFEYLEILNISGSPVDLNGVSFTTGLDFAFSGSAVTEVPAGGRVLVVRNQAAFVERYGADLNGIIAGEFQNDTGLAGGGERLVLTGVGGVIRDVTYDDRYPWPEAPDGSGPSIVLVSPETNPDGNIGGNWRSSVGSLGSAGAGDGLAFAGDATADLDGDGLNAFAEYAFGTSDSIRNGSGEILIPSISANGRFTVSFFKNLAADGAVITIELSDDLKSWVPAADLLDFVSEVHGNDGRSTFTFESPSPAVNASSSFVRLRVLPRE
ncbi:CotH kinase family protein [Verrucomicrobiaceae bacterium 227]